MKKRMALLVLMLVLLITACNGQNETTAGGGKEADVDVVALLTEVQQKSEELQSMHMDMTLSQTMGMASLTESSENVSETMTMDSDIKMDIIVEPISAYMDMTMTLPMGMGSSEDTMRMEMYMTEESVYMKVPLEPASPEGSWMKMNISEMTGFGYDPQDMKNSMASEETMNALKELKDDVTVTDQGDTYLITFKGTGEKAQKLFDAQLQAVGNSEQLEGGEITFNSIDYQYLVSKETKIPVSLKADMDYVVMIGEESMPIIQKIEGTFSKINEIEKIEIPQEALEATELLQP